MATPGMRELLSIGKVWELAQLQRFGPEFGFVERVMAKVRIPTPSGGFKQ